MLISSPAFRIRESTNIWHAATSSPDDPAAAKDSYAARISRRMKRISCFLRDKSGIHTLHATYACANDDGSGDVAVLSSWCLLAIETAEQHLEILDHTRDHDERSQWR